MRKLIVVFFLLRSFSALAQIKDSVNKVASTKSICICAPPDTTQKPPLYIIDGEIVKANGSSIQPEYISTISILKGDSVTAKYGKDAINGVVIITTKKTFAIRCLPSLTSSQEPLYVVDEIIYKGDKNKLDFENILKVDVLKDPKATAIYGSLGANGVIIIITKQFAIHQYQKKFSSFSDAYKKYLAAHNNDDSRVTYVLDGEVVKPGNKFIDTLFNLPLSKIQHVNMLGPKEFEGMTTHMVIITTKK